MAGRGAGKTRTAAEWLAWEATTHNNTRWAIVAPTFGDVRDVCAEGESGIINILRDYGSLADYNRSQGAITLTNGSKIKLFSADEPDRLRGPQHHGAWCDELAAWRYPDTWDQLQFGMRLGDHPRTVITTTPRPVALIRNLVNRTDGSVKVVRGSTFDNAKNLAPQALLELQARYAGTRMGRQELYGELLNESDSALWTRAIIEESRIKPEDAPPYFRVVVAIDPAVTSGESSDETGIVVAGATPDGHYYILEDATMRGTPEAWARKAVEMYRKWKCDRIIGEANNGGDMIEALLRQVDASIPYRKVTATRGKRVRAEPISALSEQLRLHFVGSDFAQLEDQLVTWEPDSDKSPDRMDACIVRGSLVITRRGEIPIEDVTTNDYAWTRKGWRKVLATRMTRANADVMTVELSNGKKLTGTPDHLVYVIGKGWSRLDSLVWADTLSAWTTQQKLNLTALLTPVIQTENSERIEFITQNLEGIRSTEIFTDFITGQSLKVITSITLTATHLITKLKTFSQLRPKNTPNFTQRNLLKNAEKTLTTSDLLQMRGMDRQQEKSYIGVSESNHGRTENAFLKSANHVKKSFKPRLLGLDTVQEPVSTEQMKQVRNTTAMLFARYVMQPLANAGNAPKPVGASVVRSYASGASDVFDLMIEGEHEFTANGVIVHNCVWAVTELMGGSLAMRSLAAMADFCPSCRLPLVRGTKVCPRCRTAIITK